MRRFLLTKPLTVLLSLLCTATLSPVFVGAAHAESGLQSKLTARNGAQGTGHVDVSPTADEQHETLFIAQGTAEIHDALESTTYVVQRAIDCKIDPSSPDDGWVTLTTFKTSPEGAGAGHFERRIGTQQNFDIFFRVVKQDGDRTPDLSKGELISACMTVTVK